MTKPSYEEFPIGRSAVRTMRWDRFLTTSTLLGIDSDTAAEAFTNLASGEVDFLMVSGLLASGKDAVGAAVMQARFPNRPVAHLYYALPLKAEVDEIITQMSFLDDRSAAPAALADAHQLTAEQADVYVDLLWDDTRDRRALPTARTRTPKMRQVLQFHGTEVRRSSDPQYWVIRALIPAVASLADGVPVFMTDARFPNECDMAAQGLGATLVRLGNVSREVQAARLFARDGVEPDPVALAHPSETMLDDYTDWDLLADASVPLSDVVQQVLDFLPERREAAAA